MRTIAIQADGGPDGNDAVMEAALLFIVIHTPVGLKGFKFDGGLHDGTVVNHRHQGEWVVSFRPSAGTPPPAAAPTPAPMPWCGRSSSAATCPT